MGEDEYRVYFLPFPGDIGGATRIDCDGFASIYINAYLAPNAARETFDHEIRHIRTNDFYNQKSIRAVERDAG